MDQGNEIKAGKKGWLVSVVVLVFVALVAVVYYFSGLRDFLGRTEPAGGPPIESPPVVTSATPLNPPRLTYPKFNEAVPSDMSPTSPDKVITKNVTGRKESVTVYNITAENWTYKPGLLVVKKGEQVNLNFTAVDRDYDLEIAAPIGAYVSVKKGEMMTIGFGADRVGTYEIRCQKICPDGKDMKGELVIIK